MDTKKKLIIAILCGVAAALGIFSYLEYRENKLLEMASAVPVAVAATDILQHLQIDETMLRIKRIPRAYLQPGVIMAGESHLILGQVTSSPILKGEQILGTKLLRFGKETGLAMKIPAGLRATSVLVDNVTGVAGLVKPNDFVDVLATFDFGNDTSSKEYTFTLFQNVSVLAIDTNLGEGYSSLTRKRKDDSLVDKMNALKQGDARAVTLALTPSQVQDLVLSQELGSISLALRGIGETERELSLSPATPSGLTGIKSLMRQRRQPRYREYRGGGR